MFNWRLDAAARLTVVNPPPPAGTPVAAYDDSYDVPQDGALTVSAPGVLWNDAIPDGVVPQAAVVQGPAFGSLSLSSDGAFVYAPQAGFVGTDSFLYSFDADGVTSNEATVYISVLGSPPGAVDDAASTAEDTPVAIRVTAQ